MTWEIKEIPLSAMRVAPTNVRKNFIDSELELLEESLKAEGQYDPLVVVQAADGMYEIFKGQRRYKAMMKLVDQGKVAYTLQCIVKVIPKKQQMKESLAEAILQKNISEIDVAKCIDELLKDGCPPGEIKKAGGLTDARYSFYLGLLGLNPPETLESRDKGQTSTPTTTSQESKSSAGPVVSKTGKIEDPTSHLTFAQQTEVTARRNMNPMQKTTDIVDSVKDFYDLSTEFNGLRILKADMARWTSLAKQSGSNSQKHEIEEFLKSKYKEEYFKEKGV